MSPEGREKMILDNSRLVSHVVKNIYRSPYSYYDKEDMFQEGMIGLIKAVDNFDPEKGFAFSTYAVPMIHGEIRRFMRDNFSKMKYSRSDIEAYSRLNRTGKTVDELTAQEVEELSLTEKNIAAIRSMNTLSTDAPVLDLDNRYVGDIVADKVSSEISDEYQLEVIENIKNMVISNLNPEVQDLIDEWYYSATIGMKPTQVYLGRKYGISQVHVSRILAKFKDKFAKKLEDSGYTLPMYVYQDA